MDIKKLVKDADAKTIAEYLHMETKTKGCGNARIYIRCPGHEMRLHKPDNHIGNAILYKSGYECFACGVFVNTHDMVMEHTGCSSNEAYIIMAEAMGGEEFYEGSDSEEKEVLPRLRLSEREAEVLKLYPKYVKTIALKQNSNGIVPVQDGLYILFRQNPAWYYKLIVRRAQEMLKKYEYCMLHYSAADADLAYVLYDLLGENFDNSLYKKIKRELNERVSICRKIISIFSRQLNKDNPS